MHFTRTYKNPKVHVEYNKNGYLWGEGMGMTNRKKREKIKKDSCFEQ